MKNILVPIGSSGNAINTLQYAIDYAQGTEAKLYVIKVFGVTKVAGALKKMDALLADDSDAELQAVLKAVDTKGVEIISKSVKGSISDSIERIAKQIKVDLIISSTKSVSTNEKVFLGKIAGGLIKQTDLPILFVPRNYVFKPIQKVMMALKVGQVSNAGVLTPLREILNRFDGHLDLLHVKTPNSDDTDGILSEELQELKDSFTTTENGTVFQGVLEHIRGFNPDMLCVIRRKRGFFSRIWEKDKIYKKDFESRIPLLVLKGAK
ncbi:universal stress protein [Flavobacteriaceae bacterium F08102]|nr:universal stress protein [Flavobacteriaceae bacterium F08102]